MTPFPFPLDAMPGDTAIAPDGRTWRLAYDDCWHVAADQARPGDQPLPVPDDPAAHAAEAAANHAFNARLKAEEAAERAAHLAAAAAEAERALRTHAATTALAAQDHRAPAPPAPADPAPPPGADLDPDTRAAILAEIPATQRPDGWTAERRLALLDRLAEGGSLHAATRAVGCSRQSLHRLLPRAPALAAAVAEAMRDGLSLLADVLLDRAIHGHQVPILHKGEVVATRTVHHDRLGCYLLRARLPLPAEPREVLGPWPVWRASGAGEPATHLPPPESPPAA